MEEVEGDNLGCYRAPGRGRHGNISLLLSEIQIFVFVVPRKAIMGFLCEIS
jgi:hypothetical protein